MKPLLLPLAILVTGCASAPAPKEPIDFNATQNESIQDNSIEQSAQEPAPQIEYDNPNDPLEGVNRSIHAFNKGVDRYLLKPVTQGYAAITPEPITAGVSNFFSNLDDVVVIFNDALQLKPLQLASDVGRFVVNSTLGLAGFIDWASDIDLPKHNEDFGQTLGYWGVPKGPYIVLPILGPSTLRDATGPFVDSTQFDPVLQEIENGFPTLARDAEVTLSLTAVRFIDTRFNLLKAESILETAAFDEYNFIREAYLQRRLDLIYDGNPPEEDAEFNEDELFDL